MSASNITKNALALALKKLMEEKEFDQISVADICSECNLNRKSFYYHFKDKYDLVNWIFYTDFFENIDLKGNKDSWAIFEDICAYLYSERLFYKSAFKIEGQNSFKEYFFQTIYPICSFFIEDNLDKDEQKIFISFIYNGFVAAVLYWLSEDWQMSPSEFVNSIRKTISMLSML